METIPKNRLKLLTHCQKCLNPFQLPVTLSCGFTVCYNCLTPTEQCLSFSCLRTHTKIQYIKPTVLLEKILSQHNNTETEVAKSLLDCAICFNLLQEPITTECGHTFCKECLIRTMTTDANSARRCPFCRTGLSRIGKQSQIITSWIDYLINGSYQHDKNYEKATIPIIQVTSVISFPSQPCLIHISSSQGDHLLKAMIQEPLQRYAICVFSSSTSVDTFSEYGIMLQINHVEHLPDIHHSVIQAVGLFRLKIHHLTISEEESCYTGNVTRLDDLVSEEEEFVMDRQQLKRWTLPSTITPSPVAGIRKILLSSPAARPRPSSMRLSSSAPNNYSTTTTTLENYPGSTSRKTWGSIMHHLNKPPSAPPLLPPSPIIKKPKIPSRTNSSSTSTPTTNNSGILTTLDSLFDQEVHPYVMNYLKNTNAYLLQHYELQLQQSDKTALVWWLANILPLEYNEKIHLLSMETLRERITTLIIWADKMKSSAA